MQSEAIFFIGPQGSGKGTQARILAQKIGFFYWEMGGILREVAKEDSELGHKVKQLIDSGVLLDDDILLQVAAARLATMPPDQGIIFDGIPRRVGQAEFLLNYLVRQGRKEFITLFIDLPRAESLKRLMLRAEKEHRADDTEQGINFRLDQYEQDTLPVLDFLRQRSKFITIDGHLPIGAVTASINAALGLHHD
jgi:adenylate kinase